MYFLVQKQSKTCLHDQCRVPVFNCLFLGKFRSRQRDVQFCRYSPNSRCHVSSCIFAVLLGSSSAISSLRNVICSAILYCSTKTTQPFPFLLSIFCCTIHIIFYTLQTSSKFGQCYSCSWL